MKKEYDVILFDLDGTLSNSISGVYRCIHQALVLHGTPDDGTRHDRWVGPPFVVSLKEHMGIEGEDAKQVIADYRKQYAIDGWCDEDLYPNIPSLLAALKAMGKRLGVATSKPAQFTYQILKKHGIFDYFEFIGASEFDGSRDSKSDVLKWVFQNMNLTDLSKVLLIGDTKYDIMGAQAVGIDVCGVLWGFGGREELEKYKANYIVSDNDELLALL